MDFELLALLGIIAAFSLVQSVFGIGILVFGTPTLLLIGYDFIEALSHLLPASCAVSVLQLWMPAASPAIVSPNLFRLCLPATVVMLWLVGTSEAVSGHIHLFVGVMLLFAALVRLVSRLRAGLDRLLARHEAIYHLIMGIVHGLTNLGGALLAVLAGSVSQDKDTVRRTVAYYYLAFSIVQMAVLVAITDHHLLRLEKIENAAVSAAVFLTIGNRLFHLASNRGFHHALSVFIALCGIAVLLKS